MFSLNNLVRAALALCLSAQAFAAVQEEAVTYCPFIKPDSVDAFKKEEAGKKFNLPLAYNADVGWGGSRACGTAM